MNIKGAVIKGFLVLGSVLLAILLCEGIARLAGVASLNIPTGLSSVCRHHPVLGWHHIPDQEGFVERRQYRTRVKINHLGLRDKDYGYHRQPGKQRILVLGDSFVWGMGVEMEQAFTEVMERRLDHVEVINAGVPAYGTDQALLWLETEGWRYQPDLVILLLYFDDVLQNTLDILYETMPKPRFVLHECGSMVLENTPVPEPLPMMDGMMRLISDSRLAFLVSRALNMKILNSSLHPTEEQIRRAIRLTGALIRRMRLRVEEMGARFLLVAHCRGNSKCLRVIEDFGTDPAALLTIGYGDAGYDPETMEIEGDCHWNALGHSYVASRIMAFLSDKEILGPQRATEVTGDGLRPARQ